MFKLMDKKMVTKINIKKLLIWTYGYVTVIYKNYLLKLQTRCALNRLLPPDQSDLGLYYPSRPFVMVVGGTGILYL